MEQLRWSSAWWLPGTGSNGFDPFGWRLFKATRFIQVHTLEVARQMLVFPLFVGAGTSEASFNIYDAAITSLGQQFGVAFEPQRARCSGAQREINSGQALICPTSLQL